MESSGGDVARTLRRWRYGALCQGEGSVSSARAVRLYGRSSTECGDVLAANQVAGPRQGSNLRKGAAPKKEESTADFDLAFSFYFVLFFCSFLSSFFDPFFGVFLPSFFR